MFKKLDKQNVMIIAILCAVILVGFAILVIITATNKDENIFKYELKANDTYEVIDIKDTYRNGWFARKNIVIPAEHRGKKVTSIKKVTVSAKCSIVVSEGIAAIDDNAFSACSNLVDLSLPESLRSIGNGAFHHCTQLTTIRYAGTTQQWGTIGLSCLSDSNVTSVICSDGTINIETD
ncbi:MAG: leucine-rich repeat protein [Clostridiales bacterium]|nr:leucine-rich repeat protein [Clostridiales bacterium]